MPTDEERMWRSRDTVDQIHKSVQRMVEDNKRWAKEREADLAYRKKHGGKSKDDVMLEWAVGVPVVPFVLTFLVFMYAMLPLLIKIVIRATAEWSALLQ